jgi:hypothetical protein
LAVAGLKKFLSKHVKEDSLAVLDKKLGGIINEKLGLNIVYRWGADCLEGCMLPAVQQCSRSTQPGAWAWAENGVGATAATAAAQKARGQASESMLSDMPLTLLLLAPHPASFAAVTK